LEKVLLGNHKFYKGNLHCHSNLSDGRLTPEELKALYKGNGYSFLAITDHEHFNNNSYLDDEDFITITSAEYSIKQFPEQSTLKNFNMKVCHLNFYAKEQSNDYSFCYSSVADHYTHGRRINKSEETPHIYSKEGINALIKEGEKNGFFACYNHPRWSLENYGDYGEYEGLWGVEVYNHSCGTGGLYDYDINVVDDFLRDGKKVFVSCGDDNHNKKEDSFGAFVMADVKEFSYKGIIDALLNGNFYASQKPLIHKISVKDSKVIVDCTDARQICYSTFGRRAASVFDTNHAEFEIKDSDIYFRIDVVDKEGYRANSQAYYLKDIEG